MTSPFECTRCGEYCRIPGQIHLTNADIAQLAAFLGLTEWDFIQQHTGLAWTDTSVTTKNADFELSKDGDGIRTAPSQP